MKTLVIIIHPDIESSAINRRWIEALHQFPDKYDVHQLYNVYPDEKIDVAAEQKMIALYDRIVFQFPFYWFSCPPLFKKWLDEVLTHGWAYGSKSGYKVSGKRIALAISAGIDEDAYRPSKQYKYTMTELTRPFELTFEYIQADYQLPFVYYGMELHASEDWIEKSVPLYLDFLNGL